MYKTWYSFQIHNVHVNLHCPICYDCLSNIDNDEEKIQDSDETQLRKLFELYEYVGKVPSEDNTRLYLLFDNSQELIKLARIIGGLWSVETFKKHFGSYLAALIKSGILPEGSRKTARGTQSLAKDGHVCLSITEKDIDDFLFDNNITHKKEVHYPNSNYRTDWEILLDGKKYFIEYFGLFGDRYYEIRMAAKKKIAQENDIIIISILPNTKWRNTLKDFFNMNT